MKKQTKINLYNFRPDQTSPAVMYKNLDPTLTILPAGRPDQRTSLPPPDHSVASRLVQVAKASTNEVLECKVHDRRGQVFRNSESTVTDDLVGRCVLELLQATTSSTQSF